MGIFPILGVNIKKYFKPPPSSVLVVLSVSHGILNWISGAVRAMRAAFFGELETSTGGFGLNFFLGDV